MRWEAELASGVSTKTYVGNPVTPRVSVHTSEVYKMVNEKLYASNSRLLLGHIFPLSTRENRRQQTTTTTKKTLK